MIFSVRHSPTRPPASMPRTLLVALLVSLPACVLLTGDAPERGTATNVFARPTTNCIPYERSKFCQLRYEGILTARHVLPPSVTTDVLRLVFDDSTQIFDLSYLSDVEVPLGVGRSYDVRVELRPAITVGTSTFEARDAEGLVFFSTSEVWATPEGRAPAPTGWQVTLEPGGYASHGLGCEAHGTPQVLVAEHAGRRVRLVQGESGRLGDYVVTVLIAEAVDYRPGACLDFAVPELSYTLARIAD